MKSYFEENTYEELKEAIEKNSIVLLPVGQIEEHGIHLPVKTDAFIADKICEKLAEVSEVPVIIMPTIRYGYSTKEVKRWPGCPGVKIETLINYVYDICSSLVEMGFKKIVIISSHGNHTGALEVVVRKIADDFGVYMALTIPNVIAKEKINKILETGWRGNCHGCEYETSLMLYLEEKSVYMEKATDVDILKIDKKFYPGKVFISTWGLQKSQTGIYGAPTYASREKGEKIFNAIIEEYTQFLKEF
ncbi:MAG: creatininase family protein [Candidatus Omnitrophica bacterium]|nr:creatininase family protein [Candidatus Omnitrophota bacterium]